MVSAAMTAGPVQASAGGAAKKRALTDPPPGCPDGAGHLTIRRVTTVFSAFERTARAHGAKPFLHALPEAIEYSYEEALRQVLRISQRYRSASYGPGHRVALRLPNCPEFLLHFLALNSIGSAVVPVNPDYRAAELDYVLAHS